MIAEAKSSTLDQALINGDLARLSPDDRVLYYNNVCDSLGLNALTKPLDYITLNGKMTLYAKRDCTDQLRKINGVSIIIVSREVDKDCYIVTARAIDKTGRSDESMGSVPIGSLNGEARSNAMMKAETKAKRRVTLSICGMGLLDETEVGNGEFVSPPLPVTGIWPALTAPVEEKPVLQENQLDERDFELPDDLIIEKLAEFRKFMYTGKELEAYEFCAALTKQDKDKVWALLNTQERDLLKKLKGKRKS